MFTEDLLREMSKNLVLPAFRFRWLLHIHWLIRLMSFWKASKSPLEEIGLYNNVVCKQENLGVGRES